jgi:hypothetical protein
LKRYRDRRADTLNNVNKDNLRLTPEARMMSKWLAKALAGIRSAMAVGYWTEAMARDEDKSAKAHQERLLDEALRKHIEGCTG